MGSPGPVKKQFYNLQQEKGPLYEKFCMCIIYNLSQKPQKYGNLFQFSTSCCFLHFPATTSLLGKNILVYLIIT